MVRTQKKGQGNGGGGNLLKAWVKTEATEGGQQNTGLQADWGEIDSKYLYAVVVAVTRKGGAVLFGIDKTGFGYTVTIYSEGERASKWFRPDADGQAALYDFMDSLLQALGHAQDGPQ